MNQKYIFGAVFAILVVGGAVVYLNSPASKVSVPTPSVPSVPIVSPPQNVRTVPTASTTPTAGATKITPVELRSR